MKKLLMRPLIFYHALHLLSQSAHANNVSPQRRFLQDVSTNLMIQSNSNTNELSMPSNEPSFLKIRGGAIAFKKKSKAAAPKQEATPSRDLKLAFGKIAIGAAMESFLMHQILLIASDLAHDYKDNTFATIVQVLFIGSVVFGSSTFGALIDNGLSAATKQILKPNEIPGDSNWYSNLKKPSWNPPGWVFPIMWLIISKPTQYVALWNLKEAAGNELALLVYAIHLSFGNAWNKIFFGLQQIKAGVVVISTFWALLIASTYLFFFINPTAGLFLVPTCLWVTVASSLNWNIYLNN